MIHDLKSENSNLKDKVAELRGKIDFYKKELADARTRLVNVSCANVEEGGAPHGQT